MSLELLGADALSDQYITVRVRRIDPVKLRQKLGGKSGWLASMGVGVVEQVPKAALDAALPVAKSILARDYGVELETTVTKVPPSQGGRDVSEFWTGLAAGTAVGASTLLIFKGLAAAGRLLIGR